MESIFRLPKWSTAGSMLFLIEEREKKGFHPILDTCQFDEEKRQVILSGIQ